MGFKQPQMLNFRHTHTHTHTFVDMARKVVVRNQKQEAEEQEQSREADRDSSRGNHSRIAGKDVSPEGQKEVVCGSPTGIQG